MLSRYCLEGKCRKVEYHDDAEESLVVAPPFFIQPAVAPPVVAPPFVAPPFVANPHHYEFQNEVVVSHINFFIFYLHNFI